MKKFIIFILIFGFIFSFSVSAEESDANYKNDLYIEQYKTSGADKLDDFLPNQTADLLNDLGIDIMHTDTIFSGGSKNILEVIFDFLKSGATAPLKVTLSVMGILIIFSAVEGFANNSASSFITVFVCFLGSLTLLCPIFNLISAVQQAVKAITSFMISFVPIYAGISMSGGYTASAGGFSALLLAGTEIISWFISYLFIPISGASMCLGICGTLSPIPIAGRISEFIKKTSLWSMGIAVAIFSGILSFQTAVTNASDTLGIRTSKAVLSSTIPVMGPAIAETLNTARGCLTLLRSGVGIYGAAAVLLIGLPIITELALWRISMWVLGGTAEILNLNKTAPLFRYIDFCLAILLGAVSFTALIFIIALTVTIKAG